MATLNRRSANKISMLSTVVDSVMEFRRGHPKSGLLLLGAAALSSRIPGIGTAASLLLRLIRRFR
ncbi:hypothetical protein [Natrinema salinisoli]|uniref:hypothetical protein n=1 Tax=Natrinema salinisoli TaxID=2878535 RepID=UPI001CF0918C|nr:hypothetical protein [Natrinema salinisoli]